MNIKIATIFVCIGLIFFSSCQSNDEEEETRIDIKGNWDLTRIKSYTYLNGNYTGEYETIADTNFVETLNFLNDEEMAYFLKNGSSYTMDTFKYYYYGDTLLYNLGAQTIQSITDNYLELKSVVDYYINDDTSTTESFKYYTR